MKIIKINTTLKDFVYTFKLLLQYVIKQNNLMPNLLQFKIVTKE